MAATGILDVFSVKDAKISLLLTDNEADPDPTYGPAVDVPCLITVGLTKNYTSETLTGDDKICDAQSVLESIDVAVEHGRLSHAIKEIIEGGTQTITGSGDTSVSTYELKGDDEPNFFKLEFLATKTNVPGNEYKVTLWKVKLSGQGQEVSYGSFGTNTFDSLAIRSDANDCIIREEEFASGVATGEIPEGAPDTTTPTVSSTTPTDGATGVGVSGTLSSTWSEDLRADSVTTDTVFLLEDGVGLVALDSITLTNAGASTTVDAAYSGLSALTDYTWVLAGSIRDLAGNAQGTQTVVNFTTA